MGRKALLPLLALAIHAACADSSSAEIRWLDNVEQASQIARQTDRLVLLHFWSTTCPPCVRLERNVFSSDTVVAAIEANFVPVKINVDEHRAIARAYDVRRWPSDVILTPQGEVLANQSCRQDPAEYLGGLQSVTNHYRAMAAEWIAANPQHSTGVNPTAPAVAPRSTEAPQPAASTPRTTEPAPPTSAVAFAPPALESSSLATPSSDLPSLPTYLVGDRYANAARSNNEPTMQSRPPADGQSGVAVQFAKPSEQRQDTTSRIAFAGHGPRVPSSHSLDERIEETGPPVAAKPAEQPPAAQPPLGVATARPAEADVAQAVPQPQPAAAQPAAAQPAAAQPAAAQIAAAQPAAAQPPLTAHPPRGENPPLALEGRCPISIFEQRKWVKGDPRFGAIHRGQTYLFAGPQEQQTFLANPDKYMPALGGHDPVIARNRSLFVPGKIDFGFFHENRIYLFANRETMEEFYATSVDAINRDVANIYHDHVLQAEAGSNTIRR